MKEKLYNIFKQGPAALIVIGFVPMFIASMVGGAIGHFMTGDVAGGGLFVLAVMGGLLWGWAELRARTAYRTGYEEGKAFMGDLANAVINTLTVSSGNDHGRTPDGRQ